MRSLLDFLLPPSCPGCGREGEVLCPACRRPLERRLAEPAGLPLGLPGNVPPGLVQVEWCAAFSGPARACLHALKYDGQRALAQPLGAFMAARWRRVGVGADVVVPVPVHATRLRDRGYNQAALLAREAALHLGLPMMELLRRRGETKAQHALGRSDRARNVGDAFAVDPAHLRTVSGRWFLLIDDVLTTGATLSACAAALTDAGALAVSALTVCRER